MRFLVAVRYKNGDVEVMQIDSTAKDGSEHSYEDLPARLMSKGYWRTPAIHVPAERIDSVIALPEHFGYVTDAA